MTFEQLRTSVFDITDPVEANSVIASGTSSANSGIASGTSSANKIISGMI